jgi:hypothetical protein
MVKVIKMSNLMELNKAAQDRSDLASQNARTRCASALNSTDVYQRQDALKHAMAFDAERTAMFLARYMSNGDKAAFIDGICAIHGAVARNSLQRSESPDDSPMIIGGTFGGIG